MLSILVVVLYLIYFLSFSLCNSLRYALASLKFQSGIKNVPNPPYTKMREWVPKPISQIRVSRTLLTPESTFGIILRYCAICVKNLF